MHTLSTVSCPRSALSSAIAAIALSSVFFATPLFADEMSADNKSENTIEEVVVRAHPLSAEGLAQGTVSLTGDDLAPQPGRTITLGMRYQF